MSASNSFNGIKRLAAKAGLMRLSAEDQAALDAEDAAEQAGGAPADPAGDPPADPAPAGDPPAGDPPAGDPPADPAPEPTPPAPAPNANVNTASADYEAGHLAASGRFAAVLASPAARANLELATDLLASTTMAPGAIIGMCERHKGDGAAKRLLDSTPKPALGAEAEQSESGDRRANVKQASAKVNKGIERRAASQGMPVRTSRRRGATDPKGK